MYTALDGSRTVWQTPYRLVIFANRYTAKKRYKKYTAIERVGYAVMGWTSTQYYQEARLPSAGSFLYPGLHAVRNSALDALAQPGVYQVQIRTDQDRKVYLYNKHSDGRITGYRPD